MRQQIPQIYQAAPYPQAQRQETRVASRQAQASGTRTTTTASARNCRNTVEGPAPTGGNAVAHGWCLMEMNRPLEAVKSFESALATGSAQDRSDAAYGQSLAYLRVGLVDKAAVSAIKAPMRKARQ
ncbi:cellulose synthase, partial [Ochrobactrum sp. SFR4]|nr:cellulose synthase [Ochrobactrum sp. SFR4]